MKEIILDTDDGIVSPMDVQMWVTPSGTLYGTEASARYSACTHRACTECGKPALKMYTLCDDCRAEQSLKRWLAMPSLKWDESVPVYSEVYGKYFNDYQEIVDFLDDICDEFEDDVTKFMQLVFCSPCHFRKISEDFWEDDLAEDQELPDDIYKAMDALNKIISKTKPICYSPRKYRAEF